jgi:hypothetical protein
LDFVAQDERLVPYMVQLTQLVNPDQVDLARIVDLMNEKKIEVSQLYAFKYGSALDHLNTDIVIWFCQKIVEYDPFATGVVLEIVYMYYFHDTKRFRESSKFLRDTIISTNLLLLNIKTDIYTWQETVSNLLLLDRDEELAKSIAEQFIKACSQQEFIHGLSHSLESVLKILLRDYRDSVWPILSNGLLSGDFWLQSNLEDIFNPIMKVDESVQPVLLELPIEFIKDWCDQNPDKAPLELPKLVTILESVNGTTTWSEMIKFLFDRYGKHDVLREIYRNLGPKSWSGSIIPYYKQHIGVLAQLQSHNNPVVKTWAAELIVSLQKCIERENLKEQEQEWEIY